MRKEFWYVHCLIAPVPTATFASSAGHKASRIIGDLENISSRSFPLHAKLRGERLNLIALVMAAGFAMCSRYAWADEPIKLPLTSTNTTDSVALTNSIEVASNAFSIQTNSFSLSVSQPVPNGSGATNQLFVGELLSTAQMTLVIQERSEVGTFSRQSGNGSFGFANIEAGFGQAYDNDSIVLRGRNGTAWEETRYVFFKKVVKF